MSEIKENASLQSPEHHEQTGIIISTLRKSNKLWTSFVVLVGSVATVGMIFYRMGQSDEAESNWKLEMAKVLSRLVISDSVQKTINVSTAGQLATHESWIKQTWRLPPLRRFTAAQATTEVHRSPFGSSLTEEEPIK